MVALLSLKGEIMGIDNEIEHYISIFSNSDHNNNIDEYTNNFGMLKELLMNYKEEYPEKYKTLIEERDQIIYNSIKNLSKNSLIVVGAAHCVYIIERAKNEDIPLKFIGSANYQ